jgi:hypothetical protein
VGDFLGAFGGFSAEGGGDGFWVCAEDWDEGEDGGDLFGEFFWPGLFGGFDFGGGYFCGGEG